MYDMVVVVSMMQCAALAFFVGLAFCGTVAMADSVKMWVKAVVDCCRLFHCADVVCKWVGLSVLVVDACRQAGCTL